ncbi:hypothetical protein Patl1_18431 [Pistacia atlantica]|uniref:Uncharacterized protein n=1 Tax=Pistacia atlantica TaxID=434234 RepID=A0ACC1C400_9ROSI|nr:hypothetical protein Patl1_18431 [Pistacia atlantica]
MVMAHKLMKEMGLIDLYLDMITNVSMIIGFCNVGRLEDACALLKAMRGHGCAPNAVAYSTLLNGICKSESMQMALELSGEMEKEARDCSSNVVTYSSVIQSTLIKGLCLDGIEEAYKLIDKVFVGGSVLHGDYYNSLVIPLVRTKRLKEADKLFRKMLASGMKPNGLAYGFCQESHSLEASKLARFMLERRIRLQAPY